MPLLRSLFERRSHENPARPLTDASLIDILGDGTAHAGVSVTAKSALGIPTVWRCVNIVAGTGASLPLKTYQRNTRTPVDYDVLDTPHPDMTSFELWEWAFVSLLLWGNAYFRKVYDGLGFVRELWPILPNTVQVGRVEPFVGNPSGKMFQVSHESGVHAWTPHEVLHLPGLGYDGVCGVSPLRIARQGWGLALAAEEFGARFFGSGSLLGGVLQTEQRLDQPAADALKARWKSKMTGIDKAHDVAVLDSGATFQQVGIPPGDAQFIESRTFQVEEIARWFGVPPHMAGAVTKSTSWGTGIEQQSIGFVVYGLRSSWLTRIEQRVTKELLRSTDYARFNVEGLLRGDSKARSEFYRTMREIGVFNVDEIRDLEEREPLPDGLGQGYLQPMNFEPLGTEPEPEPEPVATRSDDDIMRMISAERETHETRSRLDSIDTAVRSIRPVINVDARSTVEPAPAPDVVVHQAPVTVDAPITIEAAPTPNVTVNVPEPRSVTKTLTRDADGNLTTITEEPT